MSLSAASTLSSTSSKGPRIFGIPYGDFGLFATLLISVALGFMTFFAVTFVSIFGILIFNATTHHAVDLSHGYKYVALPAGCVVLVVALVTLGSVWLRRRLTGR
jgi:TRAP-type C4-dicarboxylate transport system permease small subunit